MLRARLVMRFLRVLLVLAVLLPACERPPAGGPGASAERDEARSGRRYRMRSRLEPRRVTLGDPARWSLVAELPAAARPGALLRDSASAALDLAPPGEVRSSADGGRSVYTWVYEVRGFDLGRIPLPAARLPVMLGTARDTILFPADTLAVDSLTPAATGVVLPDRGPVDPELRAIDYVVAALLALLALGIVAALVRAARRPRRPPARPAAPPEPADARLRREIALLRTEGEGLPRDQLYERLSLAIRDYAAAVTGVTTRDRTTREIVGAIRAVPGVDPAAVAALARALTRADLAKFARSHGAWSEALGILAEADGLPERLPLRAAPAPASAPAAEASPESRLAAPPEPR